MFLQVIINNSNLLEKLGKNLGVVTAMSLLERFTNDDVTLRQQCAHKVDNAIATSYLRCQLTHRKLKLLVSMQFRALSRPNFTSHCVC